MSFVEEILILADRVPSLLQNISTEEATKQYLIIPFIKALGYDVFDPSEVVPEFDANVGASKKYKLDYAILKEGKPIILMECKCYGDKLKEDSWSQLFHYFAATHARLGVLTNGTTYKFYADLDSQNKMDKTPFLEFDIRSLNENIIEELKKITKSVFDIDEVVTKATQLKYVGGIKTILNAQLTEPTDDFTRVFFSQLCSGKVFSPTAKQQFSEYTQKALKQFVHDQVSHSLNASGMGSDTDSVNSVSVEADAPASEEKDVENNEGIVPTEEELQGYYIIKAILSKTIDIQRVEHRGVKSYFGVLLDNSNRKPICRLYFKNLSSKRLVLFSYTDGKRNEEMISIEKVEDIYAHAEKLRAVVDHYDNPVAQSTAA